ncbi:hypothetical protein J6590_072418 [Homalodisca vitripennis]|nr:hypothetical protein J6590_072418 [Homalodisca vitripennis]
MSHVAQLQAFERKIEENSVKPLTSTRSFPTLTKKIFHQSPPTPSPQQVPSEAPGAEEAPFEEPILEEIGQSPPTPSPQQVPSEAPGAEEAPFEEPILEEIG